jgi:hypothetical protein
MTRGISFSRRIGDFPMAMQSRPRRSSRWVGLLVVLCWGGFQIASAAESPC